MLMANAQFGFAAKFYARTIHILPFANVFHTGNTSVQILPPMQLQCFRLQWTFVFATSFTNRIITNSCIKHEDSNAKVLVNYEFATP